MVCRVWRAEATPEMADTYQRIALTEVIPAIEAREIPGFLHIDMLRRALPENKVEFMTMMWFTSTDAISHFAGEDAEASHLPAAITEVLARYDLRATHFEVVEQRPQPLSSAHDSAPRK